MSRRTRRRARPPLVVPPALVAALDGLHGPLDTPAAGRTLAQSLGRLHQGLTREREGFLSGPRYLADAALRRAYATYYVCANAPKLGVALDRLRAAGDLPSQPLRVLELGAGPGTGVAGLGLWARGAGVRLGAMLVTDAVAANLEAARRLAAALDLSITTATVDAARPLAPQLPAGAGAGGFDLLLAMNVVNELPPAADALWVAGALQLLAPGGVVLCIEPAAVAASRRALALRDALVAAGFVPRFPCPHARPCPALARADDWCHAAWPLARPAFMAAADDAVGLRRDLVQATVFALRRPGLARAESAPSQAPLTTLDANADAPQATPVIAVGEDRRRARLVSDPDAQKGRTRVRACLDDGTLATLERQTRDGREDVADLAEAGLHDLWTFGAAEPVGGVLRLRPEADPRPVDEGDRGEEDR